jgi:hypothetical protein
MHSSFGLKNLKGSDGLGHLAVNGSVMKKLLFEKSVEYWDWIHLEQERAQ